MNALSVNQSPVFKRHIVHATLLALAYFLLAWVCIALARSINNIALVWYANVIALAWLVRSDIRDWPLLASICFFANIAVNVLNGHSVWLSTELSIINLISYLGGAWIAVRLIGYAKPPMTIHHAIRLLAVQTLLVTPFCAATGAVIFSTQYTQPWSNIFMTWWTGDASATLTLMLPALLVCKKDLTELRQFRPAFELLASAITALLLIYLVIRFLYYPAIYAVVILTLVTLRLNASKAALLVSSVGVTFTALLLLNIVNTVDNIFTNLNGVLFAISTTCVFPMLMSIVIEQIRTRSSENYRLNQRLQLAKQSIGLGVWELDVMSGELIWDEQMFELFDMPIQSEPVTVAQWQSRLHPDDIERAIADITNAAENYQSQYRTRIATGQYRHIAVSAIVERNAAGAAGRLIGTCRDVTNTINMENNLTSLNNILRDQIDLAQRSRNEFAMLFDALPGAALLVDKNGTILLANNEANHIFGYTNGALVDNSIEMLIPVESRSHHTTLRSEFFENPKKRDMALERVLCGKRADNSEFPIEVKLNPIRHEGELRVITLAQDITLRIEAQELLFQAKEIAETASRAKSEFVANMSHEIRTPLNAILGVAQLLEKSPLNEAQRKQVEMINSAGQSLLGIINDILDFSRIESGRMELAPIDFLFADVLRTVQLIMQANNQNKNVSIFFDIDPTIAPAFHGDALRLQQILVNLACNAVKFTHEGSVTLTAKNVRQNTHTMSLFFSIRDTGIGMSMEQIGRLFNAFTQADASTTRRYGGSGLGLVICKQLVALMGGTISVASMPGQGSEFSFEVELPFLDSAQITIIDEPSQLDLAGVHLLLVDDNQMNQFVACGILEDTGAIVDLANNGSEAIDLLRNSPTKYAAVLMDIQMPVLDGFSATEKIRQELKLDIPVIAMTAGVMSSERERCSSAGMNDFVPKPIDAQHLLQTLRQHVRSPQRYARQQEEPTTTTMPAPVVQPSGKQEEVFDIERLFNFARGKPTRTHEMIKMITNLINNGTRPIDDVRATLAQGHDNDAAQMLHALRGSIGSFGAKRFASATLTAERSILDKQGDDINTLLDTSANELDKTIAVARVWLAQITEEASNESGATIRSSLDKPDSAFHDQHCLVLQKLLQRLDEQNFDACNLYATLRPALAPLLQPQLISQLDNAIDMLDFRLARSLLIPIATQLEQTG